jgi:hypothetical protein
MISFIRLEAEGTDLETVVKDIETAAKALKVPKDLLVHDEHYERVSATRFKGRRVFKSADEPKKPPPYQWSATGSGITMTAAHNASAA